MEPLVADNSVSESSNSNAGGTNSSSGEVSIRIIGAGEHQGIGVEGEDDGLVMDGGEGVLLRRRVLLWMRQWFLRRMLVMLEGFLPTKDLIYNKLLGGLRHWADSSIFLLLFFVLIRQHLQEKLIGKGGENSVYKSLLSDGKSVEVKVLNSSEEARKYFRQEMDIMTRVKHKNIAHLLGICIEDSDLITVYDFLSRGNLEENIFGRKKLVLRWERRFRIAVGIAEALNYLYNECPSPVIHRDVKSSNILLSDDFEPQLSNFGLAIWGPTKASFLTHSDVVGTFGYLAPEKWVGDMGAHKGVVPDS